MPKAVLFDLGNTLVGYFTRAEVPAVRKLCVAGAANYLRDKGLLDETLLGKAEEAFSLENYETKDFRVRPLEGRLERCFKLGQQFAEGPGMQELCKAFIDPVFERAELYPDTIPVLKELRGLGMKLGIISNLAWGSPAKLWHEEGARHGLTPLVDAFVTCRDVGWRKPSPVIFHHTAEMVGVAPSDCLFVGDDERWDYEGAEAAGMTPLLIDREGEAGPGRADVRNLREVVERAKVRA